MENIEKEIWKDIEELNGLYQISNYGKVYRKPRKVRSDVNKNGFRIIKGKFKKPQNNGNGYLQLYVQINRNRKMFYIHRLVAKYFIENPNNFQEVNHLDFDKSNNFYNNLEWCTTESNKNHAFENDRFKKGETHCFSKLTDKKVLAIRRLFKINPNFNRSKVARKLNVKDTAIIKIIKNQRWKHL